MSFSFTSSSHSLHYFVEHMHQTKDLVMAHIKKV